MLEKPCKPEVVELYGRAAVLSMISGVITNTYTYTTDPASLLGLRQSLGELLDESLFADGFESGDTSAWSIAVQKPSIRRSSRCTRV
jgi:hypothetical protein